MKLVGKAAKEFMDTVNKEVDEQYAQGLARAKEEAEARGKEPFDLAKLELLCDTSHEGRMASVESRYEEFESKYYVHFPDVMTLQEFAEKINELNRW